MKPMHPIAYKIAELAEKCMKLGAHKVLTWVTLAGWFFSLLAEVGTLAFSKNIPKRDKQFIIPQELIGGVINLGLMATFMEGLASVSKWLVRRGHVLPMTFPEHLRKPEIIQKILDAEKHPDFIAKELKGNQMWVKKLASFTEGFKLIMSILGGILAINIAATLVSNKLAAYFQKKALAKEGSIQGKPGSATASITPFPPANLLGKNLTHLKPSPFNSTNSKPVPAQLTAMLRHRPLYTGFSPHVLSK